MSLLKLVACEVSKVALSTISAFAAIFPMVDQFPRISSFWTGVGVSVPFVGSPSLGAGLEFLANFSLLYAGGLTAIGLIYNIYRSSADRNPIRAFGAELESQYAEARARDDRHRRELDDLVRQTQETSVSTVRTNVWTTGLKNNLANEQTRRQEREARRAARRAARPAAAAAVAAAEDDIDVSFDRIIKRVRTESKTISAGGPSAAAVAAGGGGGAAASDEPLLSRGERRRIRDAAQTDANTMFEEAWDDDAAIAAINAAANRRGAPRPQLPVGGLGGPTAEPASDAAADSASAASTADTAAATVATAAASPAVDDSAAGHSAAALSDDDVKVLLDMSRSTLTGLKTNARSLDDLQNRVDELEDRVNTSHAAADKISSDIAELRLSAEALNGAAAAAAGTTDGAAAS